MKIGLIGDKIDIAALQQLLKAHEVFHWSANGPEEGEASTDGHIRRAELKDFEQTPLIFLNLPIYRLRKAAGQLGDVLSGRHVLVHTTRNLEPTTLKTPSTILAEETPTLRFGFLTGPFDARDVLAGRPSSAVCASEFDEVHELVKDGLDQEMIRVYRAKDLRGAEFAASYTRVISFLVGVGRHFGLGASLEATLATRGLAEAARIAVYQGGYESSAWGLAGCANLYLDIQKNSRLNLDSSAKNEGADAGEEPDMALVDDMQLGVEMMRLANGNASDSTRGLREKYPAPANDLFNLVESLARLPEQSGLDLPLLGHAVKLIRGQMSAAQATESLLKLPVYFE